MKSHFGKGDRVELINGKYTNGVILSNRYTGHDNYSFLVEWPEGGRGTYSGVDIQPAGTLQAKAKQAALEKEWYRKRWRLLIGAWVLLGLGALFFVGLSISNYIDLDLWDKNPLQVTPAMTWAYTWPLVPAVVFFLILVALHGILSKQRVAPFSANPLDIGPK